MSEKNRNLIGVFVFLLITIGILPMLMWGLGGGYMSGMMGMMGYGYGFTLLIPIAFLVLIAPGAYYFVTGSAEPRRSTSNHGGRAIEILRERYAKGEITKEQFLKMKAEL